MRTVPRSLRLRSTHLLTSSMTLHAIAQNGRASVILHRVRDPVVLLAGQSADIPLNWGAEGQEGPVLATGGIPSGTVDLCHALVHITYVACPIH